MASDALVYSGQVGSSPVDSLLQPTRQRGRNFKVENPLRLLRAAESPARMIPITPREKLQWMSVAGHFIHEHCQFENGCLIASGQIENVTGGRFIGT